MEIKFPNIEVQLTGVDSNAFAIIGTVAKALKDNGVDKDTVEAFHEEAMSGDYDNVLVTCMRWVAVN